MPRSSRHKSTKHGGRYSREYSGSEDDLGIKERKGGNEDEGGSVRVSKDSVLGEKRKLDSRESRRDAYDVGSGNGDCAEDFGNCSSRRRKEKGSSDGVNDRWNGGSESVDERGEGLKKARGSCDSKSRSSRRREDEVEDVKRSGGRSEKHSSRESSRKEGKEKDWDRDKDRDGDRLKGKDRERDKVKERDRDRDSEKKGKGGKGDKFGDNDDEFPSSMREITADDALERRNRKRSENADIYRDEIGDVKNKNASFVDDVVKDMRKDDIRRDEKYREKFRDEEEKSRQDKYKDEYHVKDRYRSRSREKYSRDGKDHKDVKKKRKNLADGDQDNDSHSSYDHSRSRDQEQERNGVCVHDGDRKRDLDSYQERDLDLLPEKERERDWDCDREREQDHVHEQELDMGLNDEKGSRSKDRRSRRLSPNDRYNYVDGKMKDGKGLNTDLDKTSLSSSRVEAENKGDRSSRPPYFDDSPSNNRSRVSPTSSSHGGDDGSRYARNEDPKYMGLQMESRPKANSGRTSERSSNYRSSEKHNKADNEHVHFTGERSSSSKPSPMGLIDGSSSPSRGHRYMNRSGVRKSLDGEDAGRKSSASAGSRDFSGADGKTGRDIDVYKSMDEESSRADSTFNSRQGQGNVNPLPPFRPGVESPTFMGMMEEDSRPNLNSRYKRNGDPGMGRGHMNSWRGVPNWSSPLPNGFMPFQSGPPHGNIQSIMPHFPSPHIFGVRPPTPIEINQPGLPFPLADADRFPGHLRPLGWQSMMDPSVPPRLHGWDVNNGVLRGENHFFGHDWEHNRHPITAREWESNVDTWKGHNGISADASSAISKYSPGAQFPLEDGCAGQGNRKSNNENSHDLGELKCAENRHVLSHERETLIEFPIDKKLISTKSAEIDNLLRISKFYLSRLDISEQLVHREIYKQCVDLLDGEPGLTVATRPLLHMILKNDRRKGLRAYDGSWSSSVLPSTDDSSFQKALKLYKSQRLEIRDTATVKVDPLFFILPSSNEDMNQEVAAMKNEENPTLDAVGNGEEAPQSSHLISDHDKIIDDAVPVIDEPVDELSLEPNNGHLLELQTEVVEKPGSSTYPADHAETFNDIPHATPAEVDLPLDAAEFEMSSVEVGNDNVVGGSPSEA